MKIVVAHFENHFCAGDWFELEIIDDRLKCGIIVVISVSL